MSAGQESSLRYLFAEAKSKSDALGSFTSASDSAYQENVLAAIESLEQCRKLARQISLFSPNEEFEDIASTDLPYLMIDYRLGDLILKENNQSRKGTLERAQEAFARFLRLLDTYRILSKTDSELFERYLENQNGFAVIRSNDPSTRRDSKIKRYKEEKSLKVKLDHLAQISTASEQDDSSIRDLYHAEAEISTYKAFESLDTIAQELKILALMPQSPPPGLGKSELDYRERNGLHKDGYSDRLDPSLSEMYRKGKAGPILNKDGKPLQPFTLLDSRQRLQNGVFGPDHSLPTMTIDEYLAEERRRGGIIDGGAENSVTAAQLDEDDVDKAEAETMKAREWDEFVEANPKGSGNTINRG
ncbi:uncharacterized protein KY384_007810 [Bacidia gigantensis]|uniref:uncharacterized protein n=1 Tax=Bacidia gigantensis TaxID=2732470 RepID=UPI001D0379D1|nr:uncharacterized protein KY384_007810 [Bacidia gigantensis]KAG8527657.1 hypothetical protein KY384_007810 [Bacidia gigantensis]